ncbi:hypothetical protein HYU95_00495, partial [Candidatus Daviesbacteria bacterium]|nr:hypothetical protein [Candidatus Daviesbacteria bacterium]
QWIIAQAATGRSGDFNGDSRVNSIDWACMRYDFNSEDSPEPAISSSPSPSAGVSASPAVSPSPASSSSVSPSPSPLPSAPAAPIASCPSPGTTVTFNWPSVAGASKYYLKIDNIKDGLNCTSRNTQDNCFIVNTPPATDSTTPGDTYRWSFDALDKSNKTIQSVTGTAFTCSP